MSPSRSPAAGSGRPCLVFDVGGTTIRAALYDRAADRIERPLRTDTLCRDQRGAAGEERSRSSLYERMRELGERILDGEEPADVGVAFPGPVDPEGNAYSAPTVWGEGATAPLPIRRELHRLWPGARLVLVNDVTAAGYRYLRSPSEHFCIVTVSSGIGHKLFVGGRAVTGPAGRGGEIGHLRVDWSADAPRCDCGGQGHLGAVASGRGTLAAVRRAAALDPDGFSRSRLAGLIGGDEARLTNALVAEGFHAGDGWTHARIRETSRYLGHALAALHLDSGVERFVVVGGFALALGEPYRRYLAEAAEEGGWTTGARWNSMIELGAPDDHSGLWGLGRYLSSCEG